MCNLYTPGDRQKIIVRHLVPELTGSYGTYVAPLKNGPIVLADRAVVAQWGMIPPNSKTKVPSTDDGKRLSTNNARRERVATAMTYRDSWRTGKRCIIPAESFIEPFYPRNSDMSIPWSFVRADGEMWALAGIWNEWTEPETGEVITSYTMLTQNCDAHPLLSLMHKYDTKLAPDKQDKRAVVPLEQESWDAWLNGSVQQAEALIQLPPMQVFHRSSTDPDKQVELPL